MNVIADMANKLLAKEKFGINVNVNISLANTLILKETLKEYGKLCKLH